MSFFKKIFTKEKKETLDKGLGKIQDEFFCQTDQSGCWKVNSRR